MLKLMHATVASLVLAASAVAPAFAGINATAPGYQMIQEMENALVAANDRLVTVSGSDLSQVPDIIDRLADDARTVHDAFYPATGVAADVCSRADIVEAMDDLENVIRTFATVHSRAQAYRQIGLPVTRDELLTAFDILTSQLGRVEHRLGDAIDRGRTGC